MAEKYIDVVVMPDGKRLIRIAEPGCKRERDGSPINSILCTEAEAREVESQLGEIIESGVRV